MGGAFLYQRLMADSEAKLDIGFDFSSVEGGIEEPKLDRPLGKNTVQIEGMISALVIMAIPPAPSVVPETFYLIHRARAVLIHPLQKGDIRFFAKPFPFNIDLESLVKQFLLCGHDIDDIS